MKGVPTQAKQPLWLLPNLLSLDAPLVAMVWQGLLAQQFGLPLKLAGRAALGLSVWAIYLADRLLDVRNPLIGCETARHQFCRKYRKLVMAVLGLVLISDCLLVIFEMRREVLVNGMIALTGVVLYLATFHSRRLRFPKEFVIAILFTAGTFLIAWTGSSQPYRQLGAAALSFFMLCLLNLIAIELWEAGELPGRTAEGPHLLVAWLGRFWIVLACGLMVLCLVHAGSIWYLAMAGSVICLASIFLAGNRLSLELRRTLADVVLLSPLLFLL